MRVGWLIHRPQDWSLVSELEMLTMLWFKGLKTQAESCLRGTVI